MRRLAAAAFAVAALASPAAATGQSAADFKIGSATVAPERAFFGAAPVRIEFRFTAATPSDVSVAIAGPKGEVRRLELKALDPGAQHVAEWDGLTGAGAAAPDGRYRVLIGAPGGEQAEAGALTLRGHRYPVLGPHGFRGGIGRFGAKRSGGRVHEGFDINAACGRPLVAARGGTVVRRGFDPVLYGNYVLIRGLAEPRTTYFYSHLIRPPEVARGESVLTGERVGRVGKTGNARSIGCHLHFEIRRNGRPVDPAPELRRWDRFS